ncbi:MAG: hypothetical protein RIT25_2340, partial [Planctomycetota bacterium]
MSMQLLGVVVLAGILGAGLAAQQAASGFEVLLADGSRAVVAALVSPEDGVVELRGAAGRRRVPLQDLVGIRGAAVAALELPSAHLAGGEVVRGALTGGDAQGDALELLSPSLGRVRIATDRLAALLLRPGLARVEDLRLPKGVAEGLFVRARAGNDVIAGTLHRFGEE